MLHNKTRDMIEIKSKRVKAIIDFCVVHYKKGDICNKS